MAATTARRTADPAEAFRIAREDGVCVLTGCDCSTREAAAQLPTRVFGSALAAAQTPIHVGMNNTGFSGTWRLEHTETRGLHQDQIIQYDWDELPDFFLLACQVESGPRRLVCKLPLPRVIFNRNYRDSWSQARGVWSGQSSVSQSVLQQLIQGLALSKCSSRGVQLGRATFATQNG